MKHNVI